MSEQNQTGNYNFDASDARFGIAIIIMLGGIAIFGYQVYQYLKAGIWQPISLTTAMQFMNVKWAISPTDWAGLYQILDFIPLSATVFVAGFAALVNE